MVYQRTLVVDQRPCVQGEVVAQVVEEGEEAYFCSIIA